MAKQERLKPKDNRPIVPADFFAMSQGAYEFTVDESLLAHPNVYIVVHNADSERDARRKMLAFVKRIQGSVAPSQPAKEE